MQSAKDKSRFGKGDIRGVIAPETANNAMKGGVLIPTVAFGISGNAAMRRVNIRETWSYGTRWMPPPCSTLTSAFARSCPTVLRTS